MEKAISNQHPGTRLRQPFFSIKPYCASLRPASPKPQAGLLITDY
jgi:hypothetical protein